MKIDATQPGQSGEQVMNGDKAGNENDEMRITE